MSRTTSRKVRSRVRIQFGGFLCGNGDGDGEVGLGLLDLGFFLLERNGVGEEEDEADLPKKELYLRWWLMGLK